MIRSFTLDPRCEWNSDKATAAYIIGADEKNPVILGSASSEFICLRGGINSMRTGALLARLPTEQLVVAPQSRHRQAKSIGALSIDGLVFALAPVSDPEHFLVGSLQLFSTKTGQVVHQVDKAELSLKPGDSDRVAGPKINFMEFASPRTLVVITSNISSAESTVHVIDVLRGKITSSTPIALDNAHSETFSLSNDGKYIAFLDGFTTYVAALDGKGGKLVLAPPPLPAGEKFLPRVDAIAFSPSGDEVAGVFDTRLVVWNKFGKIVVDAPGVSDGAIEASIQWVPDGSGWLLNGESLVMRKPLGRVWNIRAARVHGPEARFLDTETVLLPIFDMTFEKAVVMPIPWERIRPALVAMEAGKGMLTPGENVVIALKAAPPLFGTPEQLQATIGPTLVQVVQNAGYTPAVEGKFTLVVNYAEKAGAKRSLSGYNPKTRTPTPAVTLTETIIAIDLEIQEKSSGKVVWQTHYDSGTTHRVFGASTDRQLHDETLDFSLRHIRWRGIPRFISSDPALSPLPVFSEMYR